jgi:hypothetical protein
MRFCAPLVVFSCLLNGQSASSTTKNPVLPETVIATLNGQPLTVAEFEQITTNLVPDMRNLAAAEPKLFLEKYALSLVLASEAEKSKLDQSPVVAGKLRDARRDILARAIYEQKQASIVLTDAQLREHYQRIVKDFRQAKVKMVFVSRASFTMTPGTSQMKMDANAPLAKQKIDAAFAKLKAGGDFAALAKEYSDDGTGAAGGDLPTPIRANSEHVPLPIRNAILAARPGETVGPIEHEAGFYLFRVESTGTAAFEEVKNDIEKSLRAAALQKWMDSVQAKATVTMDNGPFWKAFADLNGQAPKAAEGK